MLGREHASIGQLGLLCGLTLFTAMSAACGGDDAPTTIAECETAQCRQTLVLETWPEDQDKAQSMIEALPAKLEQEAAISKLLDAYLGEVDALCPKYASEYTQDRCVRIRDRPHLFSSLPPPRSTWVDSVVGQPIAVCTQVFFVSRRTGRSCRTQVRV